MDLVETVKRMMIPGKNFQTRPSGEYDTSTLRAPYRFIALMLNRIFGKAHGKSFTIGWILVIFFMPTQGTIFNWANIVSNNLSACISTSLGGVSQTESKFYMSSILIDCILCTQDFLALRCNWEKDRTPVYVAYKLLWAHKYHNYYREIYELFIMPLYTLIFLT